MELMTFWYWLLAGLIFLVAAAALFFRFAGPERIWELLGPADLGNVEFETLQRRTTPNDALACPSSLCPGQSDILPPIFPVNPADLRKAMRKALMSERRLTLVDVKTTLLQTDLCNAVKECIFPTQLWCAILSSALHAARLRSIRGRSLAGRILA